MSLTVEQLLKLPCLSEAKVVGGAGGLKKAVTSVTVLEYANVEALQDRLFEHNEFYGSELVITGFINIKDDVDAQCDNIRRLCAVGEVGIILYYVGIFLPCIDKRLIEVANELDFVLITMPENRYNLRYSEVIVEAMEAIIKNEAEDDYFLSDILNRMSGLPANQRNVETTVKMISDRLHCTVLLMTQDRQISNMALWPRGKAWDTESLLLHVASSDEKEYVANGKTYQISDTSLTAEKGRQMRLVLLKEGLSVREDFVRQATELLKISINLFAEHHTEIVLSELVRAILNDEPINMRRLAEFFKIDVASINTMWVLCSRDHGEKRSVYLQRALNLAKELLGHYCTSLVSDVYQDNVVLFMDNTSFSLHGEHMANELRHCLDINGIDMDFVTCTGLLTTRDVRGAYLTIQNGLVAATTIFKTADILTLHEVTFANSCSDIVAQGEQSVKQELSVLEFLRSSKQLIGYDAVGTLSTYLLDTQQSMSDTAGLLFLHKNTVKYRLHQISERLNYSLTKMPECYYLYRACAVQRLIG